MFFAIIAALVLPDFPHNSRHFSKAELELAQLRMTEDVGTRDDDTNVSTWTAFKFAMSDYKLWVMVFALTSMVVSLSVRLPSRSRSRVRLGECKANLKDHSERSSTSSCGSSLMAEPPRRTRPKLMSPPATSFLSQPPIDQDAWLRQHGIPTSLRTAFRLCRNRRLLRLARLGQAPGALPSHCNPALLRHDRIRDCDDHQHLRTPVRRRHLHSRKMY